MYCSLTTTVSFATLSLLLFRLTFEGCRHSFATYLTRKLYEYLLYLHEDGMFTFLLTFFSYFGHLLSHVLFFKGLPTWFYLHCYPLLGNLLSEPLLQPLNSRLFFKRVVVWFYNLSNAVLNKPLNHFYVFSFLGLLVTVRLLFLSLLSLTLFVVLKYFTNLLRYKNFTNLLPMVLLPSLLLANFLNFLAYKTLFTPWHLLGSLLVLTTLYLTNKRFLLKKK